MAYEEINTKRLVVVAKEGLNSSEADKTIEVKTGMFGIDETRGICMTVGQSKNIYMDVTSLDELVTMLQAVKTEI